MTILTPTARRGATAKPSEVVYVDPRRTISDDTLRHRFEDVGVNVAFLADLLSCYLTHERCGRHLYRSVAARTQNPVLQRRYREFGDETERHVDILERLIEESGGNPAYVSPAARAVEAMDTKLLESTFLLGGSADILTQEMTMLEAVFMAESVDHGNWQSLSRIAGELPDGVLRRHLLDAVTEVEAEEEEHLTWAADTRAKLAGIQVRSALVAAAGARAEEALAAVKNWFS